MSILAILGILPSLITAVEGLFGAFPGKGAVKKDAVLNSLGAVVDAVNASGLAKIDKTGTLQIASLATDDYVAVQNATGVFTHSSAIEHA